MKKALFFLLMTALALSSAWAQEQNYSFSAEASTGQMLYYTITSNLQPFTVKVTYPSNIDHFDPRDLWHDHVRPTGSLTIPSIVTDSRTGHRFSVTAIEELAFAYCSGLTNVTIPNSVTSIGEYAFVHDSNLTDVTISNSVTTIGDYAFAWCGFQSVTIPNSVTTIIGEHAFAYCMELDTVYSQCINAPSMDQPTTIFTKGNSQRPIPIIHIPHGRRQHYRSSWGSEFTYIEDRTFSDGGLYYHITDPINHTIEVTYPNDGSTNWFNRWLGYTKPRGALTIPPTVTYSGITYSVTAIGDYAFAECSGLTSVTIPDSVTSIGNAAFAYCYDLTRVTLPDSISTIGTAAFYYCPSLTSVTIPNSVTSIGNSAFWSCTGLTSVTIPASVTSIGARAFESCNHLTEITSDNTTAPTLGEYAFDGVPTNILIHIPCGSLASYQSRWNFGISNLRDGAFSIQAMTNDIRKGSVSVTQSPSCSNPYATVVATPAEGYIFDHWSNGSTQNPYTLSVTRDITLTATFTNTFSAGAPTLYYHITSTGYHTVEVICPNSTSWQGFTEPSGMLTIPSTVTYNGTTYSVTAIGDYAFMNCSNLTSVSIPTSVTRIGSASFASPNLTSVSIPNSVTHIGSIAFAGCTNLTNITLPNSITNILDGTFAGCTNLTNITIPSSVTAIGYAAFSGCSGLTEIISRAETAPTLGTEVFTSVPTNIPVNIPCGSLASYQSGWTYFSISSFVENNCCTDIPNYDFSREANTSWSTHSSSTTANFWKIYRFSVTPDYQYTFKTGCGDGASANFDTKLYLCDASGNTLTSNDDACGFQSSITYTPSQSGYVYLKVAGYGSACGSYTLAYKKDYLCTDIPNYNFDLTANTSWGTHSSSTAANCWKIYRFEVVPGHSYTFKTGCGDGANADFDTKLDLYDASGNILASNDDACGRQSKIEYISNQSGYVYLKVGGWSTSYGSYTLAYISDIFSAVAPTGQTLWYHLTSATSNTVEVTYSRPSTGYDVIGALTIPSTVTYQGTTYTVTAIGEWAFDECRSLTSVTIPNTVTYIGYAAFSGCSGLTEIISRAETAPTLGIEAFDGVPTTIPVYIPCGSRASYQSEWSDFSNFVETNCCTAIAVADLPYTENFDSYTTSTTAKTGVAPDCWTLAHKYVTMTPEYEPMVYYASASAHSGSYSLLLNKRGIYAMPQYEGDVNTLEMSLYVRQSGATYQLEVGVMSDLDDESTFVPVATLNNATTTEVTQYTVDFGSYTGAGKYIAFRNTNTNTTNVYGCNYLDDITLTLRSDECDIHIADLPYTENFDGYTTSTTAKTGMVPDCWTLAHKYVTMTPEYEPMVYYASASAHSGRYSLLLNKRGIYAMPQYEGDVNTLEMSLYVRQSGATYQLEVGVMSDLDDESTFVPVATLNNATTTEVTQYTVDFGSYTGAGKYIAFRNTNVDETSVWGCNYLDDITLTLRQDEPIDPCTIHIADLPYTENFDSYTTSTTAKTGVAPDCWTLAHKYVTMTPEYEPMVYYASASAHSGNYSLLLNKRGIYAMPQYEGDVNTLEMSLYVRQSGAAYQLEVGVMSDLDDETTFVPVATLNNATTTEVTQYSVDFGSYTGAGKYIAFRNTNTDASNKFGCNYLDDITLTLRQDEPVDPCTIHIADLPYTENFDSYTTRTTAKTGVAPDCWTLAHKYVTMTPEYEPMVYYASASAHSGSYSLLLNKRGIYAMPQYEGDVNTLEMSLYVRQSGATYQLEVGVMSDLDDETTFVPVATLNNATTTEVTQYTVDFSSYTGAGKHIAFRNTNTNASNKFGCNYLDDITLSLAVENLALLAENVADDTEIQNDTEEQSFVAMEKTELSVYPNPTTGKLTIAATDEVVRVDVYDYTGRNVATFEETNNIDLSNLPSGIYTLRVTLPESTEVRRVVKH